MLHIFAILERADRKMLNITLDAVYVLVATLLYCIVPFNISNTKLNTKKFIVYFVIAYCFNLAMYFLQFEFLDFIFYFAFTIIYFYIHTKKSYIQFWCQFLLL